MNAWAVLQAVCCALFLDASGCGVTPALIEFFFRDRNDLPRPHSYRLAQLGFNSAAGSMALCPLAKTPPRTRRSID